MEWLSLVGGNALNHWACYIQTNAPLEVALFFNPSKKHGKESNIIKTEKTMLTKLFQ